MNLRSQSRLPLECHYNDCPTRAVGPASLLLVRRGFYYRSSDCRWVARFLCLRCRRSFSQASAADCVRQKKRTLNVQIERLLVSGVSQRRAAWIVQVNRKTVVRKFLFSALQAKKRHENFLESLRQSHELKSEKIQFDEMESFERSKCLPLSIPLVVLPESRKILGLDVCSMPAKGPLSQLSLKKYGPRRDDRRQTAIRLLNQLQGCVASPVNVLSDQNPKYPNWLRHSFTRSFHHKTVKGRRGCVVGQGELKRGGHDPLFSLNHTAAMIRANVNRMFRRTWCTTKRPDRLRAHLILYMDFHNRVLTAGSPR